MKWMTLILMLISFFTSAGSYVGKVEKIDLHSNHWTTYNPNDLGVMSLYLVGLPKSCGDSNGLNRVVIGSDHPLFNTVFSLALAAKVSGTPIKINYLDSCETRSGAWDFGFISY